MTGAREAVKSRCLGGIAAIAGVGRWFVVCGGVDSLRELSLCMGGCLQGVEVFCEV